MKKVMRGLIIGIVVIILGAVIFPESVSAKYEFNGPNYNWKVMSPSSKRSVGGGKKIY